MNWIRTKIFILIIPLLIAFLSLEIGLRVIKSVMLSKPIFEQYKEIFSNEPDKDYVFWHKPNVKVHLERGEHSYTFISNKYGHRSDNNEIEFQKSIVFLGDSIIEGATVENNETLSSQVSKELNYPTINLGLAASNTVQEYFLLKDKFRESFGMKLLILGFCVNDIEQNIYRRAFNPDVGNWEYFDTVIVDSAKNEHRFSLTPNQDLTYVDYLKKSEAITFLYHNIYLRLALPKVHKSDKIKEKEDKLNNNTWLNTEYFIKKISNFANSKQSDTLVIIFPTMEQVNGKVASDFQEKLIYILNENNIPYFDPLQDLINYKNSFENDVVLYSDNIHPNKLGTTVITRSLIKFLKKQNYQYLN